ncbi:MAG: hypothetical protein V1740_02295 [Candidatus Woesearchaeota archaeon]
MPTDVYTSRGNKIEVITRDLSRTGIGLLHRGAVPLGESVVKMSSERKDFEYMVDIIWCLPTEKGMFISGGYFFQRKT